MKACHRCNKEWVSDKKQPAVKEYCEACTAYLHCCLNCRFYDPNAHNKCRIPTTDWVGDRAGCNFCDEFEFKETGPNSANFDDNKARKAALGLLGEEDKSTPQGVDGFNKLFGD
jgi:hypothetical protein